MPYLVGGSIAVSLREDLQPQETGVFARAEPQRTRARVSVKAAGAAASELSDKAETPASHVAFDTIRVAEGLEFDAVTFMACDDEVIPLQERIENVADDA